MRKVNLILIHCSATPPDMDIGAKEIDKMHKARKFRMIGYHVVIRRNGRVEGGRELDEQGAHAKGFNENSIGICLIGGVKEDGKTPDFNYTANQMKSLDRLVETLKYEYPDAEVLGHRDLPNVTKACPCFDVRQYFTEDV